MSANIEIQVRHLDVPAAEVLEALNVEGGEGRYVLGSRIGDAVLDSVEDLTEDILGYVRDSIEFVAKNVRPDLDEIGASKATVKMAVKVGMKNGELTSLITELSGEATLEVSIEFTKPA